MSFLYSLQACYHLRISVDFNSIIIISMKKNIDKCLFLLPAKHLPDKCAMLLIHQINEFVSKEVCLQVFQFIHLQRTVFSSI